MITTPTDPGPRCGVAPTRRAGPFHRHHQSKGAAVTPHRDSMPSPEAVAADVAILNVAQAVARAAAALADARTAILEMEIALAGYNARDGSRGCGCA